MIENFGVYRDATASRILYLNPASERRLEAFNTTDETYTTEVEREKYLKVYYTIIEPFNTSK